MEYNIRPGTLFVLLVLYTIFVVRLTMSMFNIPRTDSSQSIEQTARNVNEYIEHAKKSEWACQFNRVFISPANSFNTKYLIKVFKKNRNRLCVPPLLIFYLTRFFADYLLINVFTFVNDKRYYL